MADNFTKGDIVVHVSNPHVNGEVVSVYEGRVRVKWPGKPKARNYKPENLDLSTFNSLDGFESEPDTRRPDPNLPQYLEISDTTLRKYLDGMFSEEVVKYHSTSALVRLSDGLWLIKLGPDIMKKMR